MPIRARSAAAAALTAVLTATITTTIGLAPASAAPLACKTVDSASDSQAVGCIAELRLRSEAASRAASVADERWNQARMASKDAADTAEALRIAANHAQAVADRSRARAALVTASLVRGGGSVGQTATVLMSGDGAGQVLHDLSRVSELTEDSTTLADDAARDSRTAEALQAQAGAAADRSASSAVVAKAAFDEAKKTAEAAITLVQQTETKRDRQQAPKGASSALEAAYVDLPANASTAAKVIAFGRAQIGEPYVFGAAGPGSWDCSGLTMMAFQSAGIQIGGHGATVQYTTARSKGLLVPYSQAQPGDLVFYGSGSDMAHVAIYSGGGNMIEAPHPGAQVREVPVRTQGGLAPMVARYTG